MLSHARIWAAIDALAERHSMSPSGLARRAGLDSTAFNKSKRCSADGRPRWTVDRNPRCKGRSARPTEPCGTPRDA